MKYERGGKRITKFATITPKTYAYRAQKIIIKQSTLSL